MVNNDALPPGIQGQVEAGFSYPLDVTALSPIGRTYALQAGPDERARIAERLGLQKLEELTASIEVKVGAGGFIKVSGHVDADVVQTCGLTLAPVAAKVHDTVILTFLTEERAAREKAKRDRAKARGEEDETFELDQDAPPEVARDGRIDLGEVAVAHLALALNPYPRAPGAAFDPQIWGSEPENDPTVPDTSPFAALAKLKSPDQGRG